MLVAKNVLLPHGKPRGKASHENPFAMGWIPFHGPCCRCCCTDLHRQDHYGRSDSITGLSCICQKVQALNFFNLKMKTPSSINGKLFKPTSVTCWDSSQLQELQKNETSTSILLNCGNLPCRPPVSAKLWHQQQP